MDLTKGKEKSALNEIKTQFSTSAFEALEREINDVLNDLEGDPSLTQFRIEYEKLYRVLKKSYNQEKRLVKKCRELNTEIVTNAAKVQAAIKLSQDDEATISTLRKDAERAWTMVDNLQEKELRANETTNQLQEETERLSQIVANLKTTCRGHEKKVHELAFESEELKLDLERKISTKKRLETQLFEANEQNDLITSENQALQQNLATVKDNCDKTRNDLDREQKKNNEITEETNSIKLQLEQKSLDFDELQHKSSLTDRKMTQLETQLTEAKSTMKKYLKDYDSLYQSKQTLFEENEEQKMKCAEIAAELQSCKQELKLSRAEQTRLSTQKTQLDRKIDQGKKSIIRYQKLLDDSKASHQIAQNEIQSLKREIDQFKKSEDQNRRHVNVLTQEKNLHLNQIQRTEDKVKQVDDEIQQQEQLAISLQKELVAERDKVMKNITSIRKLEHKCEKLDMMVTEQREMCKTITEDMRLRDIEIHDLKHQLIEKENELKEQKQISDEMRSERNRFSQQLIELNTEKLDVKNKEHILDQQVKQLRNEIASKEATIVKEHFDWKREKSQSDQHRNEISKLKNLVEQNNECIYKQDIEIKRYESIVRKMNDNAFMQRKEYDQIINERDILGTQLIRRNDELALLYEKLKILQNILKSGEMQYQTRIEDIRLLKLKIKDLQRKVSIAKGGVVNIDDIARELIQKHRELLREKAKVKSLSEELESPMNVHRWRKLEGSDPATYEMIQKIQILQRRLIKKTEEVSS